MPVTKVDILPRSGAWGLWHINESLEQLWELLPTTDQCEVEFTQITHPTKKLEWLASRLMIHNLLQQFDLPYSGIFKDSYGKPHLRHCHWSISIAHCYPYAAGALNHVGGVGIDIEKPRTQLLKIAQRFLSSSEQQHAGQDTDLLCHYWTAKEALYKIYGRKKLIFRENILLSPKNESEFQGFISTDNGSAPFDISFYRAEGHVVAFSREMSE